MQNERIPLSVPMDGLRMKLPGSLNIRLNLAVTTKVAWEDYQEPVQSHILLGTWGNSGSRLGL